MTGRRGATTLELLIALGLWGLVAAATLSAILVAGRAARSQAARAERREMLRAAGEFLALELSGALGGVALVGSTEVRYRAWRWAAVTCGWPVLVPGGLVVRVARGDLLGARAPAAARDSAMIWLERYPASAADDEWVTGAVNDVATTACPDGRESWAVTLSASAVMGMGGIHPGAVIVGFQPAAARIYRGSDGEEWLGQATADHLGWDPIQPIAGPFDRARSGFSWLAGGGGLEIRLKTQSPSPDSLLVQVALRAREDTP